MKVLKKTFSKVLLMSLVGFLFIGIGAEPASAASTNYWTNKETLQIKYDGYIQFNPSKTNDTNARGLTKGKNVTQAYINYSRNGTSVIGGRKYTGTGSFTQNKTFSASATAWDTLNPIANKTTFNYGWTEVWIIS